MLGNQQEANNSDKSLAAAALPAAVKALTADSAKQTQQLEQQQQPAGQATAPQQHTDEPFLIGTAISVYQNSGGAGTNWSTFESATYKNGKPRIQASCTRPGHACEACACSSFASLIHYAMTSTSVQMTYAGGHCIVRVQESRWQKPSCLRLATPSHMMKASLLTYGHEGVLWF